MVLRFEPDVRFGTSVATMPLYLCVERDGHDAGNAHVLSFRHRLLNRPAVDVLKARLHVIEGEKFLLGHSLAVIGRRGCGRIGSCAKSHGQATIGLERRTRGSRQVNELRLRDLG